MRGGGSRFRLFLTGAFSTDAAIRVPVEEYRDQQRRLGTELEGVDETTWNPDGVPWLDRSSYDEGGGYSSLVPLVLVQREGDRLVAEVRAREKLAWEEASGFEREERAKWRLELKRFNIQLFDFGVAVLVAAYEVEAPPGLDPSRAADQIRSWSNLTRDETGHMKQPIGRALEQTTRETADRFRTAVERCGHSPESSSAHSLTAQARDGGQEKAAAERGRLKWLHPVFVLPPQTGIRRKALKTAQFKVKQSKEVDFESGCFVPGVKRSVVALEVEKRDKDLLEPSAPVGLLILNWAYCAAFMDFDRELLTSLDRSIAKGPDPHTDPEAEAHGTYAKYLEVAGAKARLESAVNGLGPGQVAIWEAIVEVTRFDELIEAVDRKLGVLQRIAEARVQEAVAKSSQRSRRVVTALTVLTLLGLAVAVISYFVGDRTDRVGHDGVRFAVLIAAASLALLLFLWAEQEILPRRLRRMIAGAKAKLR
jgi:hypothetical protein